MQQRLFILFIYLLDNYPSRDPQEGLKQGVRNVYISPVALNVKTRHLEHRQNALHLYSMKHTTHTSTRATGPSAHASFRLITSTHVMTNIIILYPLH